MDLMTSLYFTKTIDRKKVQDLLFGLDGDESSWNMVRKRSWFVESKEIAERNGFFHLEMEFPFLLHNAFDYIFVQPGMTYLWEEPPPITEVTKAYIKKAMPYLKEQGRMVLMVEEPEGELLSDLRKSKKYDLEETNRLLIMKKRS
jgi:hypothetical protein